jgi:hypothetical protein
VLRGFTVGDCLRAEAVNCSGAAPLSDDGAVRVDSLGLGMAPDAFLDALEGCSCERNRAIRAMVACGLGRLAYATATDHCADFLFAPAAFCFSFAPDFSLGFGEDLGRHI